uniref:Uncharacterized protein n=1 Tax=Arundo donax TaxID=35708 RepID=A0A0A9GBJ8_ARUDO
MPPGRIALQSMPSSPHAKSMFSCKTISSAAGFGTHHRRVTAAGPGPGAGVTFVLTGSTVSGAVRIPTS